MRPGNESIKSTKTELFAFKETFYRQAILLNGLPNKKLFFYVATLTGWIISTTTMAYISQIR
jgi:hypothetical protein